jgi:hypothetical protein
MRNVIQGFFPNGFPQFDAHGRVIQRKALTPHARGVNAIQLPPHRAMMFRGGGQPLPPKVRQRMEAALQTQFGDVRVHFGHEARSIGAEAFTQGTNLYFTPGRVTVQMLAHELTHVMQQRSGRVRNPFPGGVAIVHDPMLEAEADRARFRVQNVVQRQIVRGNDVERHTINLANTVLKFTDFGTTPVTLNAQTFPGGNAATAVNAPTFGARVTSANKYAVRITAEPVNTVSSVVHLPEDPPWIGREKIGRIATRISSIDRNWSISDDLIGDDGDNDATLEVGGDPSDANLRQLIRAHELYHVADINKVIGEILRPWDDKIRQARLDGTEYFGDTQQDAESACYRDMGGTPAEIGVQFVNRLRALGDAYHQRPIGKMPTIENVTAIRGANDTFAVKLYYRHPGA